MKKILLLFVLMVSAFTYTSCSDDDTKIVDPSEDPILGKWQLIEVKIDGIIQDIDCDYSGYLFLNPDSTWAKEIYELDSHGDCTFMMRTDQGTWENLGDSMYEFIFEGKITKGKVDIVQTGSRQFSLTYDEEGETIERTYLFN